MIMNSSAELPKSLICLIGPPRSGTTLVANSFSSHSKVTGILEPYQRGRHDNDIETDFIKLLSKNEISNFVTTPHIAVKETTTRIANVELMVKLLQSAAQHQIYSGLVLIFRCPFASYLSQVSASKNRWAEKNMTEETEQSIITWARSQRNALRAVAHHARSQHFRLLSYENFCAQPSSELARLMALIPENLQIHQLQFRPPKDMVGTADPKTREKSGGIQQTDYAEKIEDLLERYSHLQCMNFLRPYRDIVLDRIGKDSDLKVLDEFTRLVAQ